MMPVIIRIKVMKLLIFALLVMMGTRARFIRYHIDFLSCWDNLYLKMKKHLRDINMDFATIKKNSNMVAVVVH